MSLSRSFLKHMNGWLGTLFLLIGAPCLLLGIQLASKSHTLVEQGIKTDAVVTDLVQRWGSSSHSGSGRSYAPLFRFHTSDGQEHIVQSPTSSNPPAYTIGDHVTVLYLAHQPQQAVINSFLELWIAPLITGIIGLIFFIVGALLVFFFLQKRQLDHWLVQHGQRIQANIQGVVANKSIRVNHRSPFQLVCTWKDPSTQKTYTFKSENVWDDPSPSLNGRTQVDVLIKPGQPEYYRVETELLFPEQ